jgi:hypothetical protein
MSPYSLSLCARTSARGCQDAGTVRPLVGCDIVAWMSFDPAETVALSDEIDAASSLFRHGFVILADYCFASRDAEPVFACLSGGAEKLLKLSFGLMTIDDGRAWPSKATMKDAGHKIVDLNATVRSLLVTRQGRSTAPGLVAHLLEATDRHSGVVQVLAVLERYAVDGRFYNLDRLGGRAQGKQSPQELWEELRMTILEANPEMLDQLAGSEHDRARQDMNDIIAWGLGMWCELLVRSWMTGVCGEIAQRWSAQLELGHTPPA